VGLRPRRAVKAAPDDPEVLVWAAGTLDILGGDIGRSLAMLDHALIEHLVGPGEQRLCNREAERLRGVQIDHQLQFCRRSIGSSQILGEERTHAIS
jgi:hypothetical protein